VTTRNKWELKGDGKFNISWVFKVKDSSVSSREIEMILYMSIWPRCVLYYNV